MADSATQRKERGPVAIMELFVRAGA